LSYSTPETGGVGVPQVELSAGVLDYEDTGEGPVIVLIHGVMMDGSLWREVVPRLAENFRCVVPTLPLGGHHRPMRPDADLTLPGQAALVGEFLDRLDLRDVTLVTNDWGGPLLFLAGGEADRVARAVVTSCEAFDNFPPGLPGKLLVASARMPGGLLVAFRMLRIRPLRRLPFLWGCMSKRPVPDEVMDAWFEPVIRQAAVRRDFRKYTRGVPAKAELLAWAGRLRSFDRPVLVAWAAEDRVMPREHGARLAGLFPDARLVEIPDSYTLIPEDQPAMLAARIREFVSSNR
jgi:pimeloyl-ACP methyl ester carboxylesterase